MKFKAWWHSHIHGHAQQIRHVSVPLWACDEGVLVTCACGERFAW